MRCPLVPLSLVVLAAGCARETVPPAAPLQAAAPVARPAAAPWGATSRTAAAWAWAGPARLAAQPLRSSPRPSGAAAPRSNLIGAPAVAPAAPGSLTEPAPLLSPDLPDAHSVKPPADEIAALKKMLRRVPPPPTAHVSSSHIPGGSACLEMLDGFHLLYSRLDHVKGIKTPVSVKTPIGGIRYRSWGKRPLVADCRFVVALEWIAPVLKQIGVTEVRYIGTYSYRMARVGRLSLHAYGLAIDIEGMVADGRMHKVSKAFTRGMGSAGCSPAAPVLDQVGCRVKAMGLFREVLTPDSNADHASHFHFGVLPLGVTLAMLPRYLPGHRHHHHPKKHATKLADETAPKDDDAPQASGKLAKTDNTDRRHDQHDKASSTHHDRPAGADKHASKHAGEHQQDRRSAKRADQHDPHPSKHAERTAKTDPHSSGHHSHAGHAKHAQHAKRSAKARSHSARHQHPATHRAAPVKRLAKRAKHADRRTRHSAKRVAHKTRHAASHKDKRVAQHAKAHHAAKHHRTAERHHHHGRSRKSDKRGKHQKH
jgi:hypothetical protein